MKPVNKKISKKDILTKKSSTKKIVAKRKIPVIKQVDIKHKFTKRISILSIATGIFGMCTLVMLAMPTITGQVASNGSNVLGAATKLAAPSGFTKGYVGDSFWLKWNTQTGVSEYQVYKSSTSTGTYSRVYYETSLGASAKITTSLYKAQGSIDGLSFGTNYYYKVKALSAAGSTYNSDLSAPVTINIPTVTKPTAPTGLKFVSSTTASIIVYVPINNTVNGYKFYVNGAWSVSGMSWDDASNFPVDAYACDNLASGLCYKSLTGLTRNKSYSVQVSAYRNNGASVLESTKSTAVTMKTQP